MRESNERIAITGIYARIRELPIPRADKEQAIQALRQAEAIGNAFVWIKERFSALGHAFLNPSLKH
jgi:hypothetical protein